MPNPHQYTPGPWYWSDRYPTRDRLNTWSLIGLDGFGVLSCDGGANCPQNINMADAHLIESAPQLLEALEEALYWLEACNWGDARKDTVMAPKTRITASNAKARGEC
jgi:hypothetical protein